MFFLAENCTEYLFVRSYTRSVLYMLSVQRIPSETHPRQAAEFVFSFRMITMLFLHDHLIYHTFSHCQVDFWFFFNFFRLASFGKTFYRRASCFFAWSFNISRFLHLSNALLRIFQTFFEKLLEEHRAFCKSLKKHSCNASSSPSLHAFQISSLVVTNGVIFLSISTDVVSFIMPLNISSIFHLSNLNSKKIEKKLKKVFFNLKLDGWG